MSKVFEEEYQKLAQSELPDLWDRIEAGLSEKNPVNMTECKTSADEIPESFVSAPITIQEENRNNTNNKVVIFFKRYQTVAAALLCVMLLIPAFLLMRQVGGGLSKSSADTEAAAAPAEEMMMAETTAQEPMESEMTAGVAEEFATDEAPAEAEQEAEAPAAEALTDEAPAENTVEAEAKSEAKMEDYAEAAAKESVLYCMSMEILQKQENIDMTEKDMIGGSVYKCMVLEDESGQFAAREEIYVWIPEHLTEELAEGETYKFDLEKSDTEYYDFVAKSLYY